VIALENREQGIGDIGFVIADFGFAMWKKTGCWIPGA
jgi:hypothetical protein